jgi:hypothetical protein
VNFSYGRMYDNARQYMQPGMQTGQRPFMGAPQGQMSQPLQAPANYSAIAQQMAPQPAQSMQGPRMGYGIQQPRMGIA